MNIEIANFGFSVFIVYGYFVPAGGIYKLNIEGPCLKVLFISSVCVEPLCVDS